MVEDEVKKGSSYGEMPDEEIDEALAESFPASDPPLGMPVPGHPV